MVLNNITTTLKDTLCCHIMKKLMNNGRMIYEHTFLTTFNVILGQSKPKKIAAFSSFLFFSGTSFGLVWPN